MATKYSLRLGNKSTETLENVVEESKYDKEEIMAQGLALRAWLQDLEGDGKRLAVISSDGEIEEEVRIDSDHISKDD